MFIKHFLVALIAILDADFLSETWSYPQTGLAELPGEDVPRHCLCSNTGGRDGDPAPWLLEFPWAGFPRKCAVTRAVPIAAGTGFSLFQWHLWHAAPSRALRGRGSRALSPPQEPPAPAPLARSPALPRAPAPFRVPGLPYLSGGLRPPPASPARPRRARGAGLRGRPPAWSRRSAPIRSAPSPPAAPGACGRSPRPPRSSAQPLPRGPRPAPGPARPGAVGVAEGVCMPRPGPARPRVCPCPGPALGQPGVCPWPLWHPLPRAPPWGFSARKRTKQSLVLVGGSVKVLVHISKRSKQIQSRLASWAMSCCPPTQNCIYFLMYSKMLKSWFQIGPSIDHQESVIFL